MLDYLLSNFNHCGLEAVLITALLLHMAIVIIAIIVLPATVEWLGRIVAAVCAVLCLVYVISASIMLAYLMGSTVGICT